MPNTPERAETMVGWFLPPACHDEVLGDLYEQYVNVVQYVLSAVSILPRVIMSQIQRNTDSRVFFLTACAICYSFVAGTADFAGHNDPRTILRIAIPSLASLLVLLIRNGYASVEERRQRAITLDIAAAMAFAAMTQLLLFALQSDLMLSQWGPSEGAAFGWLFVIVLRALLPPQMRPRRTHVEA